MMKFLWPINDNPFFSFFFFSFQTRQTISILIVVQHFEELKIKLALDAFHIRLNKTNFIVFKEKKNEQTWLSFSHFNSCYSQWPNITLNTIDHHLLIIYLLNYYSIIVGCLRIFITSNNFRCHPIRCSNKCISFSNCSIQLCRYTKIN